MDWCSTIIGALIGFMSSVGVIIVERIFERSGKLKIYVKIVFERSLGKHTWGFQTTQDGMYLNVPLWIEIQNLSNVPKVMRDVNLLLYKRGQYIAEMHQINRAGNQENSFLYANGGSYSFVIEAQNVVRYECHFALKKDEKDTKYFDQIKLRYFDEHDKEQFFVLDSIEGNWAIGDFPYTGKWRKL